MGGSALFLLFLTERVDATKRKIHVCTLYVCMYVCMDICYSAKTSGAIDSLD